MIKWATLKIEVDKNFAKRICHTLNADFIIVNDNQSLGNNYLAVQITNSSLEYDTPSDWLFQLQSWHIYCVFLNGANLHNHEQMNLFNLTSTSSC